jgi:hypothetical protein
MSSKPEAIGEFHNPTQDSQTILKSLKISSDDIVKVRVQVGGVAFHHQVWSI